jgi:hypothetical protein
MRAASPGGQMEDSGVELESPRCYSMLGRRMSSIDLQFCVNCLFFLFLFFSLSSSISIPKTSIFKATIQFVFPSNFVLFITICFI